MTVVKQLKVMIVDDAAVYRKILKDILSEVDFIEVTDTAANGDIALKRVALSPPDVVLLDVKMPEKDGLETLVELKAKYPSIGVIMVSGVSEDQVSVTMEALRKGALDFVRKPMEGDLEDNIQELKGKLFPLLNHFNVRKNGYRAQMPELKKTVASTDRAVTTHRRTPNKNLNRIDVLCIGVSTGGPNALHKVIPFLPKDLGVPVLLVQHMPFGFTQSLADYLDNKSELKVVEAKDKEPILPNRVYVAPGGRHMIVKRLGTQDIISIIDTPPVQSVKPSVDVLLESVPSVFPGNILVVIMTGMGADGLGGMRSLQNYSHYCISQSEESCVVYGMPRSIDEAGLSDERVHLNDIAKRVTQIIRSKNSG